MQLYIIDKSNKIIYHANDGMLPPGHYEENGIVYNSSGQPCSGSYRFV